MAVAQTLLLAAKILVTDDDLTMRRACAAVLAHAGYRVVEAADGRECLAVVEKERPALIVMDLDMPRLNGLGAIEQLRADGNQTPVIMLTGYNEVEHRVRGLGVGADDFLGKPFNERELLARVGAVLRRTEQATARKRLVFGDITVEPALYKATTSGGADVPLTKKEFAILELLARTPGRPVTREAILDAVWGYGQQANTRTLDTHIWRLRRKLGDSGEAPRWIRGVAGVGYEVHSDPANPAA